MLLLPVYGFPAISNPVTVAVYDASERPEKERSYSQMAEEAVAVIS